MALLKRTVWRVMAWRINGLGFFVEWKRSRSGFWDVMIEIPFLTICVYQDNK